MKAKEPIGLLEWCVQTRDGWCLVKGVSPRIKLTLRACVTACEICVPCPRAVERGVPTCEACLWVLKQRRSQTQLRRHDLDALPTELKHE